MFWSTWPLNRCWVEGLGWAAQTCSCSVDLSIQTEPSIIGVWRVCPWTSAYFICQQSLPAQECACKNQPWFQTSILLLLFFFFISICFTVLQNSVFLTRKHTSFFLSLISPKRLGIGFKSFLPYFLETAEAFGKGSLQLYLIICGRPNQGQLWWSHLHGFQVLPFMSVQYPCRLRG